MSVRGTKREKSAVAEQRGDSSQIHVTRVELRTIILPEIIVEVVVVINGKIDGDMTN